MPPKGRGYGPGSGKTITHKSPRATASVKSSSSPEYGTGREPSSMGRQGTGGKSPGGTESSPALQGASLGDRNVKFNFNSNPDKPDAMPRRKS